MTVGDGLACLAMAIAAVGLVWAAAWLEVRQMAFRSDALRKLGEQAWVAKTAARWRPSA